MLSKGGKISHRCSGCKSTRIIPTKKGIGIQGEGAYVNIPANHFFCLDCFGHAKWNSRLKVSCTIGDTFDGVMTIDDFAKVVKHMDKIVYFRKSSKFYSEKPEVDGSLPNYGGKEPTIQPGELTQIGVQWGPDGKEDYTHWTHRPDDFGIWVGYNSWRFKDPYDIMLKDGTIHKRCSPNGSSFFGSKGVQISDYDVIAVRLCTFDDLKDHWLSGGETKEESDEFRSTRNADMFGCGDDTTPAEWAHIIPALFDIETKRLKTVKIKNASLSGEHCGTTMEQAHSMFNSPEAKALLQATMDNQMSDEDMLKLHMPMYFTSSDKGPDVTDIGRGLTRPVIFADGHAFEPGAKREDYFDPILQSHHNIADAMAVPLILQGDNSTEFARGLTREVLMHDEAIYNIGVDLAKGEDISAVSARGESKFYSHVDESPFYKPSDIETAEKVAKIGSAILNKVLTTSMHSTPVADDIVTKLEGGFTSEGFDPDDKGGF